MSCLCRPRAVTSAAALRATALAVPLPCQYRRARHSNHAEHRCPIAGTDRGKRATTPSGRFDVVFESVGGQTAAHAVAALAPRGHVVWFGQTSGEPISLDFFSFLAAGQGFSLTHFVYSDDETGLNEDLEELVGLAAAGALKPHIGSIEDLGAPQRPSIASIRAFSQVRRY